MTSVALALTLVKIILYIMKENITLKTHFMFKIKIKKSFIFVQDVQETSHQKQTFINVTEGN